MLGKTIQCPRCARAFIFEVKDDRSVTDTGVMRILGDMSPLPPPPAIPEPTTRACDRCGNQVSRMSQVCPQCNCYIGAMPMFLRQMHQK